MSTNTNIFKGNPSRRNELFRDIKDFQNRVGINTRHLRAVNPKFKREGSFFRVTDENIARREANKSRPTSLKRTRAVNNLTKLYNNNNNNNNNNNSNASNYNIHRREALAYLRHHAKKADSPTKTTLNQLLNRMNSKNKKVKNTTKRIKK